jgi:hypothetical protein
MDTDPYRMELSRHASIVTATRSRDGNGSGRRVKRQFCDSVRPSKSYTRPIRSIPPGLKISARPVYGPIFLARLSPARPIMQCSFLKSAEKRIFLSI